MYSLILFALTQSQNSQNTGIGSGLMMHQTHGDTLIGHNIKHHNSTGCLSVGRDHVVQNTQNLVVLGGKNFQCSQANETCDDTSLIISNGIKDVLRLKDDNLEFSTKSGWKSIADIEPEIIFTDIFTASTTDATALLIDLSSRAGISTLDAVDVIRSHHTMSANLLEHLVNEVDSLHQSVQELRESMNEQHSATMGLTISSAVLFPVAYMLLFALFVLVGLVTCMKFKKK